MASYYRIELKNGARVWLNTKVAVKSYLREHGLRHSLVRVVRETKAGDKPVIWSKLWS